MSKSQAEGVLARLMEKLEGRAATEQTTEQATQTETPPLKRKRLPTDPDKRRRKLSLARMPARIPVMAFDELCRALDMRPLSKDEREEGIEAWSALFWYYGLTDPRVLVLMWMFGCAAPRFVDWVEDRRRKRQGLAARDHGAKDRPGLQTVTVPVNGAQQVTVPA